MKQRLLMGAVRLVGRNMSKTNRLKRTINRFFGNNDGSIVPIYALLAIAMTLIIGFAIDFRRVENSKSRMQDAADAATLAAAREYINLNLANLSETERKNRAIAHGELYFQANLAANEAMIDNPTINISIGDDGAVTSDVDGDLQMLFGGLAGVNTQDIAVTAVAAAGDPRKLEIVLALDNSTSMFFNNRMNLLRAASKNFVDLVFDGAQGANTVQIGVVPWAGSVNILSEAPGDWNNAAGSTNNVDAGGSREIPPTAHSSRLTNLYHAGQYSGSYTSDELAKAFAPVGWRGCVSAGQNERMVDASGNVTTPLTDAAPSPMRWPALLIEPGIQEMSVTTYSNGGGPAGCRDFDANDWDGDCGPVDYVSPTNSQCQGSSCSVPSCTHDYWRWDQHVYIPEDLACSSSSSSVQTATLRSCISDPNEHAWLKARAAAAGNATELALLPEVCNGASISAWNSDQAVNDTVVGPNLSCPSPMLPMSQSRPQIYDKLNHIHPTWEATHADLGLMWGLRMLSDRTEWTNFWGYSNESAPLAFDSSRVRKMVVLLSDGLNTAPISVQGYYGCTNNSRLYGLDPCPQAAGVQNLSTASLDNLMIDACDALKQLDVEVFTIALDLDSNDTAEQGAITLLANCATSSEHAYNITSSELSQTFASIAQAALRLTY